MRQCSAVRERSDAVTRKVAFQSVCGHAKYKKLADTVWPRRQTPDCDGGCLRIRSHLWSFITSSGPYAATPVTQNKGNVH